MKFTIKDGMIYLEDGTLYGKYPEKPKECVKKD